MDLTTSDPDGGLDFDEEAAAREEAELEKLLLTFEDEPPIRHNVVPESDGEEFDDPMGHRTHIKRGDGRLYKDQTFFNAVAFKEAVLDYALRTCRNITQYRYDKDKVGFRCLGKAASEVEGESRRCEWQCYASILPPKSPVWKIRLFKEEHSFVPNGDVDIVKVPAIARLFLDKIRDEPEYYMPMKIEETIKDRWKINVSRPQCQAARTKALRWIEKEYDHQFTRLRDYAAEIQHSNENSTVVIETLTNAEGEDEFNRFYVCFDILRRTWKETCRPIIGVDGTFVKTKMKGQLLVAIGRDADNAIYPIAWAVVQVENTPNWLWFIKLVKADLDLKDGEGFILISDRQKGLIKAVELELPKMEHRMCVRHIYANLKKNHGKKSAMKPLIWNLSWSYNEAEYKERLDRILCYDSGVYADVMKSNPRSWCRAFYKLGGYCEDVENNFTESWNKTVSKAREMPFVPMLETIRRLTMARIAKRSFISHKHKGLCTPYVIAILAAQYQAACDCKVTRATNNMYEVRLHGCSYIVSLDNRTCSCKKWEICGIPCEHGYGVIIDKKLLAEEFVCYWFKTEMWKKNYVKGLEPQRGFRFWPSSGGADVNVPPEPAQPGRKKLTKADKKRKRGVNESPTKKQPTGTERTIHCRVCGEVGHNSRRHKKQAAGTERTTQQDTYEGSQAESQVMD